jgi:hypothetical protein
MFTVGFEKVAISSSQYMNAMAGAKKGNAMLRSLGKLKQVSEKAVKEPSERRAKNIAARAGGTHMYNMAVEFKNLLTKKASFGDNHNDGSQFDTAASDPTGYGGGPARVNPSANPSFDFSGGAKKIPEKEALKQGALRLSTGLLNKISAERDDTARGVSEGLDKEYNGADPVRNLDDAAAQKEVWKRQLRARKCSPKA